MPNDTAIKGVSGTSWIGRIPAHWRMPLTFLAVGWAAVFALTFGDWVNMFDQWWNISTYNHVLFVPLIFGWLIHARKEQLAVLVPAAWWPGLIPLSGALLLWLLGSLAGVNTASQLGAVVALQACVLTIFGPRIAVATAFPLAYGLFLVPFGDELVPALQMITAELVIALTEWSGIPAIIDGVFIDTPVGLFEVAEACSGVKFLIAMAALGTLISYACFKSWKRRIAFMTAAIALPILANGVRAWGTIYIAQFQGVEFAEGFDHIFYGWIFFALVVAILLGTAWRWFDRDPDDLGLDFIFEDGSAWSRRMDQTSTGTGKALAGIAALIAVFGLWNVTASRVEAQMPTQISLPVVEGWQLQDYAPVYAWQPKSTGADHRLLGRYRNADGLEVDVLVALYSAQEEGREATAFGEGAFDPNSDWRWLASGTGVPDAKSDILLIYGEHKRLVQTSYRAGDVLTGSAVTLKLVNMRSRLLLAEEPTIMLVLSSELQEPAAAEQSIAEFREATTDTGEWLDRIAGLR